LKYKYKNKRGKSMGKIKYCAITGTLGQVADRYMRCGYKDEDGATFDVVAKKLAALGVADGAELCYESVGLCSDADAVGKICDDNNLGRAFVNSAFFNERRWQKGSLSSFDPEVRKQAMDNAKILMDFTEAVGGAGANLWLGQDGFDYPLTTDYVQQWDNLVGCLRELCDYKPNVKLAIEPKLREPRNRSLIDTVATALLMCQEIDRDNMGLTIDVGHTLQAGGNMAKDLELADKFGKLFNVHVNDNYGSWDDDMIVGSVHLIEWIEVFYVLKKMGYDKWVSVDIFPYREDSYDSTGESILYMKKYEELVDKIGFDRLTAVIEQNDACAMMKLVRENIF
jgi:sugar phosphate isomerase/epimerase